MIISVEKLREYINTDKTDSVLEDMLQALELLVRKYTNNNFQKRAYRRTADIVGSLFVCEALVPFKVGDTVQVSESPLNEGLYTIKTVEDAVFAVNEDVLEESNVLVTKIEYPMDVKMGVVNMIKWDLENREKVGIASETISRHSVTYFNMDGDNSTMGYPKSLLGFLKPYMKARF
ncbi:hypothetical protein [Bacillus infantis]|uniref:hypothetical protein n=1 Tax=Bacillus infantis TaxID=324767 RepID=UPI003CE770D7